MLLRPTPLARQVIGAAVKVHESLGLGLLESAYELCLVYELTRQGLAIGRQVPVPVIYDGTKLDCAYRVDVIVERELLLEIKSVERVLPIHSAQVLTYLRLLGLRQGMIMNFNAMKLVDGLKNILA